MAAPADHGARKAYWLLGPDGHRYESTTPGTLGGNARAKIYGRLDCGSALAAIRDHGAAYTQHRVFFADEEAAVAAGYRPCGNCMRDRFVAWRESQARKFPRFIRVDDLRARLRDLIRVMAPVVDGWADGWAQRRAVT